MSNRADEIKKRIARRKKDRQISNGIKKKTSVSSFLANEEEKFGGERFSSFEGGPEDRNHPLFQKEVFMFKVLASICLVLVVGILFKNQSAGLEDARKYVSKTMENDFQFAAVSSWYEDKFGSPLAILPTFKKNDEKAGKDNVQYAIPAMGGKILESFQVNGQGIMVETESESTVEAMNEGYVTFAGKKDHLGKTVIIQHADGSETWYGHLESIKVPLYEFVQLGQEVGKVTASDDGKTGTFYFAIKQGEDFIDPIQVIKFE
ncbi:M23 family metallopeptidase [Bacillus timonensis]|nr:M23 family metallopeptidase [Bacillus timonensis]